MKKPALALALALLSPLASGATINFDKLNATGGNVSGAALNDYLGSYGVVVTNVTAGATVTVQNDTVIYGGGTVVAPSSPNILTAVGPANGISYTLNFSGPQAYVQFTRAELKAATSSGVSHCAWTATALDANGATVATVSEPLMTSSSTIPAATFRLKGAVPIAAVVIFGNAENFAGFGSPVLDNLLLPSADLPVAGTVEGVSKLAVLCENLSTGQSVMSGLSTLGNFTTFNCDEAGLPSKKGDNVRITITGTGAN